MRQKLLKETESALPAGEMYSYLTGEPVSETIGKQRPVCDYDQ